MHPDQFLGQYLDRFLSEFWYNVVTCSNTRRSILSIKHLKEDWTNTGTTAVSYWIQRRFYDYKADLTGIGNRSLISMDDTSALLLSARICSPVLGTTHYDK